jgi:hypothetical protein
LGEVAAQA